MALALIRTTASATKFISSNVVHPTFYPYPLTPVLHAARISLIFRSQVRRTGSSISWLQDVSGYLIMCWAGQFAVSFILGLPPAQFISPTPWIIYISVHVFLAGLFSIAPLPPAHLLDSTLPFLDAIARTAPITGAIESVRTHPNSAWSSSLFAQVILGTIACAASSVVGSTLRPWEPEWALRTPPFIKSGTLLDSFDIWSGALSSITYASLALTHPDWSSLLALPDKPFLTPLAARAASVIVLATLYTGKAFYVHFLPSLLESEAPSSSASTRSSGRRDKKSQ